MSIEELNALLELASRAPKTGAEALWLRALIERLKEEQEPIEQSTSSEAQAAQSKRR